MMIVVSLFIFYSLVSTTEFLSTLRWSSLAGTDSTFQVGTYYGYPLYPGARTAPHSFVGKGGGLTYLYMFGGYGCTSDCSEGNFGYLNDFWRWRPENETNWELLNLRYAQYQIGTYTPDQMNVQAIYEGIKGKYLAQYINLPSGRMDGCQWVRTDSTGYTQYYLYGGEGIPGSGVGDSGVLLDLWKFNTKFMGWKLLQAPEQPVGPGPFYASLHGVYPLTGEGNSSVVYPGGRKSGQTWVTSRAFYLFGGSGLTGDGWYGRCADMWRFEDESIATGVGEAVWHFEGPDETQFGVDFAASSSGCLDSYGSSCHPGGVSGGMAWAWNDVEGDDLLYLYGGSRIGGVMEEVWVYSANKQQWKKLDMEDDDKEDMETPGKRINSIFFPGDDMLPYYYGNSEFNDNGYAVTFGGYGDDQVYYNDVWVFDSNMEQWDIISDARTPESGTFSSGPASYPKGRRSGAGWMVGEKRYLFGGETTGKGYMSDFWLYEMDEHFLMQEISDSSTAAYVVVTVFTILFIICCVVYCCYCCCFCVFMVMIRTLVCNETYLALLLWRGGGKALEAMGWEIYWDEGEEYELQSDEEEFEGEGEFDDDRRRDDDEKERNDEERSDGEGEGEGEGEEEEQIVMDEEKKDYEGEEDEDEDEDI